jgi:hypothetical protein
VALKIEKTNLTEKTFEKEIKILEHLRGVPGLVFIANYLGVPKLLWSGIFNGNNAISMQLLSYDLSFYMRKLKTFSLKCVLNIAS